MSTVKVKKKVVTVDLFSYTMEIISQLKKDRKYPAVHTYLSTLKSILAFRGNENKAPAIGDIFTPGYLKEYENWLLQRGLSLNTVSTYMRTLRAIYNRWQPVGCAGYNPKLFDNVYTRVVSQTKRALTERQVNRLLHADFETLPTIRKRTLGYFLLMFLFRGMPFIDLAHLRKNDMHGDKIIYRRHKTGKQITIRIPREAVALIKQLRNSNTGSPYLFPILDSPLHDDWSLYLYYQRSLSDFNKSLRWIAAHLLPGVKVSSYTARHTWATLAYHLGMPVGIICQSLGHSSVRVTETYLKPFENEQVDKANRKLIFSVIKSKWRNDAIYNTL